MNDMTSLVLLVSATGWLVLAIYGYRSQRVSGRKTLVMAAIWLGIFLGLVSILTILTG